MKTCPACRKAISAGTKFVMLSRAYHRTMFGEKHVFPADVPLRINWDAYREVMHAHINDLIDANCACHNMLFVALGASCFESATRMILEGLLLTIPDRLLSAHLIDACRPLHAGGDAVLGKLDGMFKRSCVAGRGPRG